MRKIFAAVALLSTASLTTIAIAQTKPVDPMPTQPSVEAPLTAPATGSPTVIPDARSMASDAEVGQARRAYRAACSRVENAGFCDCVTAGVAQELHPDDVRTAARTIRDRITAEGDAADNTGSSIAEVEARYVNACEQFR
jgi:hypothetical protein